MIKARVFYILLGVTVSTATYAFFAEWTQMPMQMMQGMAKPQTQQPLVCDCRCN